MSGPHMVVAHMLSSLHLGGQERVALELASGQSAAGHEVMVISFAAPPDGPLAASFRERGVSVHRVVKRPGFDITLPFRLAARLRGEHVTVVHTHNRLPLIYGAAAGKLAGATVVHTRHGPGRGTRREQWLRSGAGHLVDAYVAVSPEMRDLAESLGDCAPRKLVVIENGIDLVRFGAAAQQGDGAGESARRAARRALDIPEDAWVVGTVGRLAPEKEYPLLVRALAPLLGPKARLVIVGDGGEAAAIRSEIDARQVQPYVALPGARDDVPQLLAAMDVFALSSRLEGLPLSALEAMAAGLPVVATAVGGLPGLIENGVNGFLVPSGDERALHRQLQALRDDPALARAVGARGQAHVRQRYSREAMVERYLALYQRVGARA